MTFWILPDSIQPLANPAARFRRQTMRPTTGSPASAIARVAGSGVGMGVVEVPPGGPAETNFTVLVPWKATAFVESPEVSSGKLNVAML